MTYIGPVCAYNALTSMRNLHSLFRVVTYRLTFNGQLLCKYYRLYYVLIISTSYKSVSAKSYEIISPEHRCIFHSSLAYSPAELFYCSFIAVVRTALRTYHQEAQVTAQLT